MDWSSFLVGAATAAPLFVAAKRGAYRWRGRRLRLTRQRLLRTQDQLRSSTATIKVLAARNVGSRRAAERAAAPREEPARSPLSPATSSRPAEAKPLDWCSAPARTVADPAATLQLAKVDPAATMEITTAADPTDTVVLPAQRDATVVLPARVDPSATVELPPAPPVLRLAPGAGMAEYPRRPRLAGGRGPS